MESINNIELRDEHEYPDEKVLRATLGASYDAYVELLRVFDEHEMSYEWRYYRDGKAWLCKVQKKKRTIVWMSAWKGFMKATIYFPERYQDRIDGLDISEDTKRTIESTKKVGKSQPCIFEIRDGKSIRDFTTVMKLKIACR
ncbi:MAG: DUF3788 family protein [Chitinivibrionales bacterium]